MGDSITIDNLDADILERLRAEAARRGLDPSGAAKQLLVEALGRHGPAKNLAAPPYRDLAGLAGTWSDQQAEAFLSAIADFERVDPDLWK